MTSFFTVRSHFHLTTGGKKPQCARAARMPLFRAFDKKVSAITKTIQKFLNAFPAKLNTFREHREAKAMTYTESGVCGNHFDGVESSAVQLKWIGGMARLQEARSLMEQLEPSLPRCPFCGAPTVLESCWAYCNPAVHAMCSKCRSATQLQVSGESIVTKEHVSLATCIMRAADLWKRRAS